MTYYNHVSVLGAVLSENTTLIREMTFYILLEADAASVASDKKKGVKITNRCHL